MDEAVNTFLICKKVKMCNINAKKLLSSKHSENVDSPWILRQRTVLWSNQSSHPVEQDHSSDPSAPLSP